MGAPPESIRIYPCFFLVVAGFPGSLLTPVELAVILPALG